MFELTNEQRNCFALPPVLDSWQRIQVKAGPYDHYITYAFLDGRRIVKVIQVSDATGREMYHEYSVDQMLSEDGTKILPKTEKGKPQNLTAPNLVKKTQIGMALNFVKNYVSVENHSADQCYYCSIYNGESPQNLHDLSNWVDDWCRNTGEQELTDIQAFSKRVKTHQKYKEGDFFRYRINRNLYGYGRILVNYAQMRKDGIPFWDTFMGLPLCVAVYHVATEDRNVTPEQLVRLKMLPSQMIMDNIFFYGECEIIGNIPIAPDEDNYTIHYGKSCDARKHNYLYYQCGKTFIALEGEQELDLYKGHMFGGFSNRGIGWSLDVTLPILLACIKKNSNSPYWDMISPHDADRDLRNPKFKKELKMIKKQMGIQ